MVDDVLASVLAPMIEHLSQFPIVAIPGNHDIAADSAAASSETAAESTASSEAAGEAEASSEAGAEGEQEAASAQ
jgi:DNA repair exonuclease SbcCD nuclease subunit